MIQANTIRHLMETYQTILSFRKIPQY